MPDPSNSINETFARLSTRFNHLVEWVHGTHAAHRTNIPLLSRLTAHLGIIALTIIGLLLSGIEIRAAGPPPGATDETGQELPPLQLGEEPSGGNLLPSVIPITIVPQRARREVVQYVSQPGDTISAIAARFHITGDSILWANSKLGDNPDTLSIGQTLNIPPTSGVLYTVVKGDTIIGVAAKFKAKPENILNDPFNQSNQDFKSNPPILAENTFLMVPGGERPFQQKKVVVLRPSQPQAQPSKPKGVVARGTSNFVWPTDACITQGFWARHPGFDLAAPIGTPIRAADSGYVEVVGWDNTGYGKMILVNHGNGFITRYAHLSVFNVEPGQSVKKGDLIGRMGSTGHSTGPHLHFEIILSGIQRNPSYFVAGRIPPRCYGY